MGRLTKATTDEIERLRKEGYTQKEVAERLKVHPRTVRKYDPLRQEESPKRRSVEDRLAALEEAVRTSWDWISLLHSPMLRFQVNNDLDNTKFFCPRCGALKLSYDDGGANTYLCRNCGHQFSSSLDWCYSCLSLKGMDYIESTDEWICRRCGAKS